MANDDAYQTIGQTSKLPEWATRPFSELMQAKNS